jgi:hypothetical protein
MITTGRRRLVVEWISCDFAIPTPRSTFIRGDGSVQDVATTVRVREPQAVIPQQHDPAVRQTY